MSEVHISAWISIVAAVVVILWFSSGNPTDERWQGKVARVERAIGWLLVLVVVIGIPLCAAYFYLH